jgi:hypothetical protein
LGQKKASRAAAIWSVGIVSLGGVWEGEGNSSYRLLPS